MVVIERRPASKPGRIPAESALMLDYLRNNKARTGGEMLPVLASKAAQARLHFISNKIVVYFGFLWYTKHEVSCDEAAKGNG